MKLLTLFLLISTSVFSQFQKTDSIGNFYVIDHNIVWQKSYPLHDEELLNQKLKENPFTSGIDLNYDNSKLIQHFKITGEGLPQYAQKDYNALVVIDVFPGYYRVSVKSINFPDFNESYYYNGIKTNTGRGTLEHYILMKGTSIKRTTGASNVLYSFDTAFSQIFDPMAQTESE